MITGYHIHIVMKYRITGKIALKVYYSYSIDVSFSIYSLPHMNMIHVLRVKEYS